MIFCKRFSSDSLNLNTVIRRSTDSISRSLFMYKIGHGRTDAKHLSISDWEWVSDISIHSAVRPINDRIARRKGRSRKKTNTILFYRYLCEIKSFLPIKTYCAQCIRLHRHLVAELMFQLTLIWFSSRSNGIRHSVREKCTLLRTTDATQTHSWNPGNGRKNKIDTKKTTVGDVAIGCDAKCMDAVAIGCFSVCTSANSLDANAEKTHRMEWF